MNIMKLLTLIFVGVLAMFDGTKVSLLYCFLKGVSVEIFHQKFFISTQ